MGYGTTEEPGPRITFVGGACDGYQVQHRAQVGDTIHMPIRVLHPEDEPFLAYLVKKIGDTWEAHLIRSDETTV